MMKSKTVDPPPVATCPLRGQLPAFIATLLMVGIQVSPALEPTRKDDRFVVLAHNDTAGKGSGAALVFEYRPGAAALVERAELAPGSSSPDNMFDQFDGFLRHQVNHPRKGPHETHFLHLDVDTWRVRKLLVSDQIRGLYAGPDRAYLSTDKGIRVLDRRDLSFEKEPLRFEVIRTLNRRYALIRQPGAKKNEAELFDFREGKTLARLHFPGGNWNRYALRDDAAALAVFPGSDSGRFGFGKTDWVKTKLYLYDLKGGERHTVRFTTKVSPGSGVPVIYHTFEMQFAEDGSLELTDGNPPHYKKVDPESGEVTATKREWVERPRAEDEQAKAIAELVQAKTDFEMHPNYFFEFATLPGGRFLALTEGGQSLVYGDLNKRTVLPVPNPSRSVDVNIYALPAEPDPK